MKNSGNNYVHGTAARQLEFAEKQEYKNQLKLNKRKKFTLLKARILLYMMVTFVLVVVVMYRYTMLTELNYSISKYNGEYTALKNENIRIRANMEKQMDLNKIRQIAEQRLGMQKPDGYQIVYLRMPKSDFTVQGDQVTENKGKEVFGKQAWDVLKKKLDFLF